MLFTVTVVVAIVQADRRSRAESAADVPVTPAVPPLNTNVEPVSELLTACMEYAAAAFDVRVVPTTLTLADANTEPNMKKFAAAAVPVDFIVADETEIVVPDIALPMLENATPSAVDAVAVRDADADATNVMAAAEVGVNRTLAEYADPTVDAIAGAPANVTAKLFTLDASTISPALEAEVAEPAFIAPLTTTETAESDGELRKWKLRLQVVPDAVTSAVAETVKLLERTEGPLMLTVDASVLPADDSDPDTRTDIAENVPVPEATTPLAAPPLDVATAVPAKLTASVLNVVAGPATETTVAAPADATLSVPARFTDSALNVVPLPSTYTPVACPTAETLIDVAASEIVAAVVVAPDSCTPVALPPAPLAVTVVGTTIVTPLLVIAPAMLTP